MSTIEATYASYLREWLSPQPEADLPCGNIGLPGPGQGLVLYCSTTCFRPIAEAS